MLYVKHVIHVIHDAAIKLEKGLLNWLAMTNIDIWRLSHQPNPVIEVTLEQWHYCMNLYINIVRLYEHSSKVTFHANDFAWTSINLIRLTQYEVTWFCSKSCRLFMWEWFEMVNSENFPSFHQKFEKFKGADPRTHFLFLDYGEVWGILNSALKIFILLLTFFSWKLALHLFPVYLECQFGVGAALCKNARMCKNVN